MPLFPIYATRELVVILAAAPEGGNTLVYGLYIGIDCPKGYGFSAVLVINRLSFCTLIFNWIFFSE